MVNELKRFCLDYKSPPKDAITVVIRCWDGAPASVRKGDQYRNAASPD
jgi:hypothetical protein